MKKSILIIVTVIVSVLNAQATNHTSNANTRPLTENMTDNHPVKVYNWKVATNKEVYPRTSLSIEDPKQMICLASIGKVLRASKIESYFVLKTETKNNSKRHYFWEVKTKTGYAKGYTSTEAYTHKMMQLVASGDAIVSKKIISQPQQ